VSTIEQTSATNIFNGWDNNQIQTADESTIAWPDACDRVDRAQTYWLTTNAEDGPHTRPVLAVLVNGRPCFASASTSEKSRLLQRRRPVSLAASTQGIDVVVRGDARRVVATEDLTAIAAAYQSKYGWPVEADGEALTAPYGAPTAGPPPYLVFAIEPKTIHAFGTDDQHGPLSTRWTFTT
jgi:nitroimidazol reductase NimA-like FMN-containing flavoprotein (pyridoxamine 5'-phosphate oxidase superfamily)